MAGGDEAPDPGGAAGGAGAEAPVRLVVGLGSLEQERGRPGQTGRGLCLPLGPRPEALQRSGRRRRPFQRLADGGSARVPARGALHPLRPAG
jgi:hypothetical protein